MAAEGIIAPNPSQGFEHTTGTLIIGAGAAGLVAALSATEAGQQVLVLERDPLPSGSTALSAGLIPAAGTQLQASAGIEDTAQLFARDIQAKAHDENDPALVNLLAENAGGTIDWLVIQHGLPFSLITDFDYPGHSRRRMHGLPTRSGRELIDALRSRCEALSIDVLTDARVTTLFADGRRICGVELLRPDGNRETIGCNRLILACNGFGGNRDKVQKHMPDIQNALWFGHDGNTGDALDWGQTLGAQTRHLGAYQGHGNVAYPHGILISWAVITQGGFQVNRDGLRFWDESQGYSEAARAVLAQPGGVAFAIFDERIAAIARQFEDFRQAEAQGSIHRADTVTDLADSLGLPREALGTTLTDLPEQGLGPFGRVFAGPGLHPPYCGVQVTGALFHTQGGMVVDDLARVLDKDNHPFPNLFAAGGAACGVSGKADSGYLSGNGLLSAVVLGRIAGQAKT